MELRKGDALIVVDVQRDFLPGGALPVPRGDEVVPLLNRYIDLFLDKGLPVIFTRDWHPADHISFRPQGGPWPPHCVQGTPGAEFAPGLRVPEGAVIVSKAAARDKEAYSGFDGTGLHRRLRELGISRLFIGGLATDYCVKATVLDALKLGYAVYLLVDAVRGVDVNPGDSDRAIAEMISRGAKKLALEGIRP